MIKSKQPICPLCKQPLIINGRFEYEDICHASIWTDQHVCENPDCELHISECCWNDEGDFYRNKLIYEKCEELFPNEQYAALNSFAKKMEVEVYGKGLKRKIYLSPWLTFRWLQPMIEFNYKGDEMGNVLGRKWKIRYLKKDTGLAKSNVYCVYYRSDISRLCYQIRRLNRSIKDHKKRNTKFTLLEISRWYDKHIKYDEWYSKISYWYLETFYGKLLQESLNYKEFKYKFDSNVNKDNITMRDGQYLEKISDKLNINLLQELLDLKCKGEYITYRLREKKLERLIK